MNWPPTSTPSTAATNARLPAVAVVILAAVLAPGCLHARPRIEQTPIPGEEVLLNRGDPAPFNGVLLPPGIYKGSVDEIDRRYEEIYGRPRPHTYKRGL